MVSIYILYEHSGDLHPHGASYIRLLLPLSYSTNANSFKVSWGATYTEADIVIVDRLWQPQRISLTDAMSLVASIRQRNACLIYNIDDNLLDLELDQAQKMIIGYFAREADGLIVSTRYLQERFACFNKNIFVVQNAIDERLFEDRALRNSEHNQSRPPKVIGYMGTYTHLQDLMMILQPLRAIMRRYQDEIELHIIGVGDPTILTRLFERIPLRILDVERNVAYPDFIRWMKRRVDWDIAIAPLQNSAFTRCKSDIKFLDYSALGIAGIYSQVPAYQDTISHLETGYLVENRTEAWYSALETMLTNPAMRNHITVNAKKYVFTERTLKQCAQNWREAILSILNNRKQ